jgi:membrane associated rhomboid family serine protease
MQGPRWLTAMPIIVRYGVAGAIGVGVIGCVVGLVIGLYVRARTPSIAMFEVGFPSAVGGFAVGSLVGGLTSVWTRQRQRTSRR